MNVSVRFQVDVCFKIMFASGSESLTLSIQVHVVLVDSEEMYQRPTE